MEEKEQLTTNDVAMLLGAVELMESYAHHLASHVRTAFGQYEAADNDVREFVTAAKNAKDCCNVLDDCVAIIRGVMPKMIRIFNN